MKITLAMLKAKHACAEQRRVFKEIFPNGVEVTKAICVSVSDRFDWDWAAKAFLPPSTWAEYERDMESAHAEYRRSVAPALAAFDRGIASAYAEYKRSTAPAFGKLAEGVQS